jgi:hypothetical protein
MVETLIEDIYKYLESYSEISEEAAEELAQSIKDVVVSKLQHFREPSLSMSSIGKKPRKIYMDLHHVVKPNGRARLKFLYGDIIEALVLWLCKLAGHSVTDQQKSVQREGITGSIDAIIDGTLCDVKSCSSHSFKKFSNGTLPLQDSFGYLPQISGYRTCLNQNSCFFLAVDKVTGELATYFPDPDFDLPNIDKVIEAAKKAATEYPEEPCEKPVPFGKSGNEVVASCCKTCPHLFKCFPDVKEYKYSTGSEYFTKIVKEPRLKEEKDG